MEASRMINQIKSFLEKHAYVTAEAMVPLPMEATQLATATGVAVERHTVVFAAPKWFKLTHIACQYLNLATTFESDTMELPKYLWATQGRPTSFVFVVAQSAV